MGEVPVTRPSLLVRIRDTNDRESWREFVDLYAPLIYGLARRRGLQDADAADLTQEVFRTLAGRPLNFDPNRGTFRGWLFTVARNRIHDFLLSRAQRDRAAGDSTAEELLNNQPAPEEDSAEWDRDYERRLFHVAAEQIRGEFAETTWRAFWSVAVEGASGEEAAQKLGLSVGAVYVAKSRVLARLRKQIRELQAE